MYECNSTNIYEEGDSGNVLLASAIKFITLQQRQSKKKLSLKPEPVSQ
jgi:hypothetical protein